MKPVFQTRFGADGNCWPACLASLFEVPLEEVDHLACTTQDWRERTEKWLGERGLFSIEVRVTNDERGINYHLVAPKDGTLVILSGHRKAGSDLLHVVIAKTAVKDDLLNFIIVHDPLPDNHGRLYDVEDIILFGHIFEDNL